MPLLDGAIAHFVCRSVRQLDAGDHVIAIGEVERYETFDGEPLVFHSGSTGSRRGIRTSTTASESA